MEWEEINQGEREKPHIVDKESQAVKCSHLPRSWVRIGRAGTCPAHPVPYGDKGNPGS